MDVAVLGPQGSAVIRTQSHYLLSTITVEAHFGQLCINKTKSDT